MDKQACFANYVSDRQSLAIPGWQLQTLAGLSRHLPPQPTTPALLCFTQLNGNDCQAQIQAQIDFFKGRKQAFEWKVYGLDQPADLEQRLAAMGFVGADEEVFMLYPLAQASTLTPNSDRPWQIREICDAEGIDDLMQVQEAVWQRDLAWVKQQLLHQLHSEADRHVYYCAYADGQPIASGWTDYPQSSAFPELHGGAVLPAWRGKGVFADILKRRLQHAHTRAYQYMAVDASPMSRPILERFGFVSICHTRPMLMNFN